ncbi:hypothetical protein KC19_1G080900 [Ceratodon purpureus]|uniref:Uncharacterized protein n=2 Tax=Ceratodon purpureus TaxID=3225 RepID=A0A8T0J5Z3_CERPU|nr:hypothetical protein KC19_1G080900 [Ceratodon purpureus]
MMENVIRLVGTYYVNKWANDWLKKFKRTPREGLPLLLSSPQASMLDETQGPENLLNVFGSISRELLEQIHYVNKHLMFWQTRAQGSEKDKVKFMMFERGPIAFLRGLRKIARSFLLESTLTSGLVSAAYTRINERVTMLNTLRKRLAIIIGQVHLQVAKMRETVDTPSGTATSIRRGENRRVVSECVIAVLFSLNGLEGVYDFPQSDYHGHGDSNDSQTIVLEFDRMSEDLMRGMDWTDYELQAALRLLSSNVLKLKEFLYTIVPFYEKPRSYVRHWLHYSGGAVGLAVASVWLVQHSRLGGSDDLERWIDKAREDSYLFLDKRVHQPLTAIKGELFDTFRKRREGSAQLEEVKLASDALNRMAKEFVTQTEGIKVASTASDQELMRKVMSRYEQELVSPVRNLLGGELARGLLIQVQKLKLDVEMAVLDLNQILRANEINFAILAFLPAFACALILGALIRHPFYNEKGAEGRGRRAQMIRRMLMVEVEKGVMCCQIRDDENRGDNAAVEFGMLIYSLDQLHKGVHKAAEYTGEWASLRRDILDLANPKIPTFYKLSIAERMERVYDCLAPMPKWLLI